MCLLPGSEIARRQHCGWSKSDSSAGQEWSAMSGFQSWTWDLLLSACFSQLCLPSWIGVQDALTHTHSHTLTEWRSQNDFNSNKEAKGAVAWWLVSTLTLASSFVLLTHLISSHSWDVFSVWKCNLQMFHCLNWMEWSNLSPCNKVCNLCKWLTLLGNLF